MISSSADLSYLGIGCAVDISSSLRSTCMSLPRALTSSIQDIDSVGVRPEISIQSLLKYWARSSMSLVSSKTRFCVPLKSRFRFLTSLVSFTTFSLLPWICFNSSSYLGYRSSRHQGVSPPTNSPPRFLFSLLTLKLIINERH